MLSGSAGPTTSKEIPDMQEDNKITVLRHRSGDGQHVNLDWILLSRHAQDQNGHPEQVCLRIVSRPERSDDEEEEGKPDKKQSVQAASADTALEIAEACMKEGLTGW